jgi:subtilase family serine protease
VSSPLSFGNSMTVGLTAANQGDADAPPFFVGLYLSTDTVTSADDVLFAFCNYGGGLPAGAASPCNFTDLFVASASPGTYHVLVYADPALRIPERDELNNTTVMPGTVEVQ